MRFFGITILLLFCGAAHGVVIERNNQQYRAVNTHLFTSETACANDTKILVSADSDLTLIPVKNPSNPIFSVKNPSFSRINQKIKLKIDGKTFHGKIIAENRGFFEIDIPFGRGHSGIAVFYTGNNDIAGLLSHYVSGKHGKRFFVTRLDYPENMIFEKMDAKQLFADLKAFQKYKQYEALAVDALFNAKNKDELKKILQNLPAPEIYSKWHSTYLKNEAEKSKHNINEIYKRFTK